MVAGLAEMAAACGLETLGERKSLSAAKATRGQRVRGWRTAAPRCRSRVDPLLHGKESRAPLVASV